MTVIAIETQQHHFMCKGETKVIENVKEIKEHENGHFELVINKNWSVHGNFKYTKLEII